MLIAGECAKRLTAFKQVSVEKESYWLETCFVAREYARRLTVLNQVSVETESQGFETCLLHGNVQSRFPFSIRFRWKKNLIGLRQVYCRRKCKAANCFQTVFSGNRISLVGEMLMQEKMQSCKLLQRFRWKQNFTGLRHALLHVNMQGGSVLNQVSVETESYWLETCLLQEKMQGG